MISAESLGGLLIQLIVGGLVFWLLWWLIQYVAIPEPFNKVARVVLAVFAVLFCINLILALGGHPLIK